jgi:hypothetical protein
VPVVLVLLAGLVGFLAHAAGEFGPMVVFGHADANRDIPLAWVQIPLHVVLAITLAVGGPTGPRALVRLAGLVVVLLHFMWMTLLTVLVITSLGDYTDLPDLLAPLTLALMYGGAFVLTQLAEPRPATSA